MNIALVVAAAENNVIGKNNQLLWRLPNDTKFFKNTTWGMPVIMGRKTFDSLGKPLAGRTNIVITRQNNWTAPGAKVVANLEEAMAVAADTDAKEAFVIGGGEIYALALPLAQRIYLTRVHGTFEGDAYFPVFDEQEWELLSNLDFPVDEKHAYAYSFQVWGRR